MQYRKFTKDKLDVSLLGFGCMRLPVLDDKSGKIDEDKATEIINYAIEKGVNYFDTAYNYLQGNSETFLGKVLKPYRDRVYIATKLPIWLVKSYEDFERLLDEQLDRLQTDYIDFYLLHNVNKDIWERIAKLDVFRFLDEAKEKGKINYAGFSFHDEFPIFKEVVDSYSWDFCQIQLNYMDKHYQAGIVGLKYAAEKDISLVIMEPIKGGRLANAPEDILEIWNRSPVKRSPAEWALRWVFNFQEVSVVLSGMRNLAEVKENIATASNSKPNSLTEEELRLYDEVGDLYNQRIKVGCTGCEYCIPCPSNVNIPTIFTHYNHFFVYGIEDRAKSAYKNIQEEAKDSTQCVECGACEQVCPQNLDIIEHLKEAHRVLSS